MSRATLLLGSWVKRFLLEHLVAERNLAVNTQKSYRDTLVLLLPFTAGKKRKAIELLTVDDLSVDMVKRFLDHLETERGCSTRTRNQRLAALHAIARFIAQRSPEHMSGPDRSALCLSNDTTAVNCHTWTSRRWMPSWPLLTAALPKDIGITHCCSSSTTEELVRAKLPGWRLPI